VTRGRLRSCATCGDLQDPFEVYNPFYRVDHLTMPIDYMTGVVERGEVAADREFAGTVRLRGGTLGAIRTSSAARPAPRHDCAPSSSAAHISRRTGLHD
jgi:hypothetical protein